MRHVSKGAGAAHDSCTRNLKFRHASEGCRRSVQHKVQLHRNYTHPFNMSSLKIVKVHTPGVRHASEGAGAAYGTWRSCHPMAAMSEPK